MGFHTSYEPYHDKTNKMTSWPRKDSDQPGHLPSLIRVFAVRLKKAWVLNYSLSTQRRLIRLSGCPGWSESSLCAQVILLVFVMLRLILMIQRINMPGALWNTLNLYMTKVKCIASWTMRGWGVGRGRVGGVAGGMGVDSSSILEYIWPSLDLKKNTCVSTNLTNTIFCAEFLLPSRKKKKKKFIPTDHNMFQKIGQKLKKCQNCKINA